MEKTIVENPGLLWCRFCSTFILGCDSCMQDFEEGDKIYCEEAVYPEKYRHYCTECGDQKEESENEGIII